MLFFILQKKHKRVSFTRFEASAVYWRHSLFIGVNAACFSKTYYNTKFEDVLLYGSGVVSVSETGTTAF